MLKQILLITDGCSNRGENPISVVQRMHSRNVSINVIGIVERNQFHQVEINEIENIAKYGVGTHQIVYIDKLTQTVQMVTRKAMTQTIQGVVNDQLRAIFQKDKKLEDLSPTARGEVINVVDELSENVDMAMIILVDVSASMKDKLMKVKEALYDLSLSMEARAGKTKYQVNIFPGVKTEVNTLVPWTNNLNDITSVFSKLKVGGYTPTGPALKYALEQFSNGNADVSEIDDRQSSSDHYYESETI